jgi:paraquat-inducible protein B
VLYFTESLRGLVAGAPVTLLGLPAGEVTAVGLDMDPARGTVRGRVEIVSYPDRLVPRLAGAQAAMGEALLESPAQRRALFEQLVEKRKLRAQLRSGSLLTGQLYVAFDFFPDAAPATVDWNREVPVLPAVPSTLPDLEAKLSSIIAKLDRLPYEAIGADVTKALGALTGTLNEASKAVTHLDSAVTPDLQQTLVDLRRVLANVDGVLQTGVPATLDQLNTTLEAARVPLATADRVLQSSDATLLSANAPVQQELREALAEITQAARALRGLMDYLDRHPESLIRGKVERSKP